MKGRANGWTNSEGNPFIPNLSIPYSVLDCNQALMTMMTFIT